MTIFSLGNACDLEHFTNNTKVNNSNNEDFDMPKYQAPVVPFPTEPPNPAFNNTKYQWKSDSAVAQDMTTYPSTQTFHPMVGQDSQSWGSINFGADYWGGNTTDYSFDNKLLNNSSHDNQVGQGMVMPNMRPQNAHMPTSRSQFMQNEDFNGRPKGEMMKKQPPKVEPLPEFPYEKIMQDQKNVWTTLIILFIILIGTIMYRSKYF